MSNDRRTWRAMVTVAGLALLASACGLTSGSVHNLEAGGGAGGGGGGGLSGGAAGGGASGGGAGGQIGATGAGGSLGGGGVSGGGFGGVSGGASGGAVSGAGGSTSSGGPVAAPSGGCGTCERIGIDTANKIIHIGLHAPQTGAAPVPLQAFQTGSKLFWENHTVLGGYRVVVDFMDDQYNPDVARRVCEQLSRQDFLVIGGAGTDQIQACASDPVLGSTHTPYLSDGVTTNGLTGLFNYFAISQTYAAQTPEVYTNTVNLYPTESKGKWAIITESTPNFDDVTAAMANVLRQHHVSFVTIRTSKYGGQQDAANAVTQARQAGATAAFLDIDPNFWIDMIQAAAQQLYTPAWVGPGVTNGEDLVATAVCGEQPNVKASFLSPFFGLDRQPPGFTSQNNPAPDPEPQSRDLEMDIYGSSEIVYYALQSVGSIDKLTRDNFISAMPHLTASYGPQLDVYPTVNFNGGHFGSTGAWAVKLDCSKQEYTTVGNTFLTS
ncbi:MAG TPA: ABC transporter substrate-binding protein [Acidimicrobiales bacterium]|nr:ABC transporter substrate-binding protein [Acidimicrobiales bacterium]